MKKIWKYVVVFIISLMIGMFIGFGCNKTPDPIEIPIELHDTTYIEKERIITHTDTIFVKDTLLKVDSVIVEKDGVYVQLPMTWHQYNDTISSDSTELDLQINHHGVISEIDSIKVNYHYFPTIKCPDPIQTRKWGLDVTFGVGVGYGYGIGSPRYGSPEVGLYVVFGPSYRITK